MFQHLLVPLDGSALAEAVLPLVRQLAERFDSQVTLVRVVTHPYDAAHVTFESTADLIVSLRREAAREASHYLQAHQNSLASLGLDVAAEVVINHRVAETLLEVCAAVGADTIVMSTHGRGGLSRWVHGSVADRVLRASAVPVLLVRPGAEPETALPEKLMTGENAGARPQPAA